MKNSINKRDLVVIALGAILLIGGAIGFFVVLHSWQQSTQSTFATPTNGIVALTPIATSQTKKNTPSESSTPIVPALTANFVIPNTFAVHPDPITGLEKPLIPDRIVIPSVGIDAPVVIADFNLTNVEGETFGQWLAPSEKAAGWQPDSALLGQVGNTVINGHHNEFGEVFGKLVDVKVGDKIFVYSGGKKYSYIVANRMILMELFVSTEQRMQNARWLGKSNDVRLTLVTCWPKISNTYRLILVASPDPNPD